MSRSINPKEKTIFLFGGLGNQLFQIAAGIRFAKGSRLIIDLSLMNSKQGISQPDSDFFNWKELVDSEFRIQHLGYVFRRLFNLSIRLSSMDYSNKWSKSFYLFSNKILSSLLTTITGSNWQISKGVGFDDSINFEKPGVLLGYFQTYAFATELMGIQLSNPSEIMQSELRYIADSKFIVVHVRLGDYRTEGNFGIQNADYFFTALEKLWSTKNYKSIYLFSDEIDAATSYIPLELRENVRTYSPIHFNAAETLELMRHGSAYILSNSTFSWWAAQLSYSTNPRVIVPKKWFTSASEPLNLIPQSWERL